MQWVIGNFAWFFFKLMNISGAEAVIAAGSPFVGQGESAVLVKPYVDREYSFTYFHATLFLFPQS
jgi:concentrative nucleoside transporter, CNT family